MSQPSVLSLQNGRDVIVDFIKTLPNKPGVYKMSDDKGQALYIGKAKMLKKRVPSYTRIDALPHRLKHMVASTASMECIITGSEAEALLLEANLIKSLKPRFNILLTDDKSFPYIHITGDHDFPMIRKHRGAKKRKGEYFGPFASAGAVNRTVETLQRVFMLRNCTDHVFANRSRPCLQYHIKRCTAPCVDIVTKDEYADQVYQAQAFMNGDNQSVQKSIETAMHTASEAMDFEKAAAHRDRLKALNSIHATQDINVKGVDNADVMVVAMKNGRSCVQIFFFRGGRNFGHRTYFPKHGAEAQESDILTNIMIQFYTNKTPAPDIYVNADIKEQDVMIQALSERIENDETSKHTTVSLIRPHRGDKKRMIDFAVRNAAAALDRHVAEKLSEIKRLEGVAALFNLPAPPKRIEVYDNSHIQGTHMVGGMIVAGENGFQKNAYRIFNIKEAAQSDDTGMMREVMKRRFRHRKNGGTPSDDDPDLVLIDGGLGQLNAVRAVFEEYGITDIPFVAIAKGVDRNAGREQFFMPNRDMFQCPANDPTLHYLQTIRDEAHRFAVGAHSRKRGKAGLKSSLDSIEGIGAVRKQALLTHFGSVKAIAGASIDTLASVRGISKNTARIIYEYFHEG